jgi:hypothetical protein
MHYHLGGGFDDEHTHEWFRSGPTVDVTGSSTLTFGINLGNNATGFTNSAEADVKVTLIGETSVASDTPANTDDLYAEIKLEKLKWEIGSAEGQGPTTAPEISTMLKMGAFSIQTYSAPKIVVDFVDDDDEDDADVTDLKVEYKGSGGLKLGYDVEPVMLRLSVISKDDWKDDKDKCTNQHSHVVGKKDDDKNNETDDIHHCHAPVADTEAEVDGAYADDNHIHGTSDDDKQVGWTRPTRGKVTEDHANEDNAYAFLGEVHLDIGEKADLDAAVAYAHEYADGGSAIGIGAKATFDLDNIDPYIAFDGSVPPDDSGIAWDVGGGVKWTLSTKDEESYFDAGLLMYAPAGKDSQLGVMVTLKEGDEDKGSLLGLGAEISVGLNNVTADASDWSAKIAGHYKVEGIKPFFDVTFNSKEGSKLPFTAGLELSMLKHLTTTIQYMSTNVTGDKPDRGEVTAAIKIEY